MCGLSGDGAVRRPALSRLRCSLLTRKTNGSHARRFRFCRCAERSSSRASRRRSPPAGRERCARSRPRCKGDRLVFAVAQRDNTDEPTPDILYSMGVIARIGQIQRGLGGVQLLLQGEQRATALQYTHDRGLPQRRRHAGRGDEAGQRERPGLRRAAQGDPRARRRARRAARPARRGRAPGARRGHRSRAVSPTSSPATSSCPSPRSRGCSRRCRVEERLRRVLVHVQRQIGMLEAQEEIKSQVQEELGERQREMYLREQMKAIQKELGDDDQSQGDRRAAREARQARAARRRRAREVERELGRLERAGRESMEAQVIRTYLEWIAELPWNTRSDDNLDLTRAQTGARRGPLRPARREGSRARVPRRAPAARAADGGRAQADRRDVRSRKLKATRDDATPTLHPAARGRRQADHRREGGEGARDGEGPDPAVRRPAGRRQDVDREVDRARRSAASTCASRSAACATRRTFAATAARTSARCPAASSRA